MTKQGIVAALAVLGVVAAVLPAAADAAEIKVISTGPGRRPSAIVPARFLFKTANPSIFGDNAASFTITNITAGAQMWYTTNGSDPVINGTTINAERTFEEKRIRTSSQ